MDADDRSMNSEVTMPMRGIAALGRIDQYELVSELGGGGFGTVYLAKDTVSGVEVAVKGLPPFVKNNREEMENIRANFALVSRLHHPNIAAALVLHPAKSVTYASEAVRQKLRVLPGDTLMVMEYAPGVTLSQWRKQFPERRVPIDKALEITRQIASALDYAHERKIIHRDIKPANVMIETAADGAVTARVLDFGLAAEIRSSMGRVSQEIHDTSGTRPYMAPEQWLGGKQGPATDQYALAVLFNELVTGDVPFASVFETGDPVVMMNVVGSRPFTPPSSLPKPMRRALSRALAKKPGERFASCGDFVAALEGRGFSRKERKGGRLLFAAVLLAALAGGGYFAWTKYDAKVKAREAELARVKQEVYELKGKASQAREKNAKEDWHNWPHFSLKAKELEGAFRAGEAALEKDDYAVARVQFLKVRANWYWLSSNKVVRAEAEAMRAKVETARQSADSARVAEFDTEGFATATNDMEVASRMLEDGDFSGALSAFRKASSAFEVAISSAKTKIAIKAEADRKAKEAAEKRAAELRAEAERRAKEEAEKAALSAKKAEEVVWQNCLKLKIQTTDEERADITDALSFDCRRGWFHYNSFEDCRKADWNDPYVLYLLGKHAGRRSDNWEADEQLELAFYKKSIELGCTNAIPDVKKLKWKLSVKPYFDVIKADDLNKIKQIINETNPCIGMTNSSGRTLMYWAALYADAKVLAYLDSIGHAYNIEDKSGETPLFAACANTNGTRAVSCLEWLVAKGADINARNYKASEYSNPYPILGVRTLQAFNYLIDKGAKTDVKGDHGNTLLHRVARFADDFGLVSKVVSLFGEVDIRNEEGMTPLHYAAYGHSDCADRIIELLVDKGADVRAKVSAGYHKGYQPIHLLASDSVSLARDKERSKRCIYALCRSGADVDAYTSIDGKLYEGVTPLMLAAKEGNVAAVEALLAHGADASLRSKKYNEGYMALHMVEGDKQDACLIVEKLCVKGCKIDVPVSGNRYYSGHTLLHLVCGGHEYGIRTRRLIRAILARGASKERRTTGGTYDGYTALGLACEQVNFSAVKVLLESGCAVSAFSGKDGEQAIHIIAKKDYSYLYKGRPMYRVEDVIKCLVDHGANVNAQLTGAQYSFKRGLTPLHVAADCSTPAPVELLIKYGANVNLTDDAGRTPLWLACDVSSRNKKVKVRHIKILLAHGANPNHRDKKGVTLLSQVKDGDVRKLLMDALDMVGHNSSTKQFIDACKAKEYVAAAGLMNSVDLNDAVVQFYFGLMYTNGHGVTKDWAEAVKWYRKSAEQGDMCAQNNLGLMYDNGHGVAKDEAEAARWYRKAAEQGYAIAQRNLGIDYANGWGVSKDEAEAVRWYRKAAEQDDRVAQYNLGVMYANGQGVEKNNEEAVKWYRKSADQGDRDAQNNLGWMYENGRGVAKDDAEAVKWYRKAAEQGHVKAQYNLGVMYGNGRGVVKDETEAVKWYRKASEQGHVEAKKELGRLGATNRFQETLNQDTARTKQFIEACKAKQYVGAAGLMNAVDLNDVIVQFYFGLMYANGYGVSKDEAEAVKWYRKSAEQGDKDAQNNLGNMYANGRGVAKDEVEAVRWYRKAADQKDSFAQFNLGVMYGNGRGVARDDVEAVKWFRKAAEQGNVRAQREMGWRYQKGSGVVQNLALAVEWYRKAADQGYSVAQFDLGVMYKNGWGVAKDEAEAAKWYRKAEENGYKKPKPKTASLSSAAQKLVGNWSCYCSVTYHDSLGSRADDRIKRYLPVSSTIRLTCREDGTVKLSDSSGRTFGESSGRWQYRHGMLLMDLEANDGRKFRLSGVVNWRGESFELHYDNGEYANMLQMKCQNEITDINAVLSSYVNGQMEVSISTKAPSFKNGVARCSAHVFSRL